jgi:hypothetical protein
MSKRNFYFETDGVPWYGRAEVTCLDQKVLLSLATQLSNVYWALALKVHGG